MLAWRKEEQRSRRWRWSPVAGVSSRGGAGAASDDGQPRRTRGYGDATSMGDVAICARRQGGRGGAPMVHAEEKKLGRAARWPW